MRAEFGESFVERVALGAEGDALRRPGFEHGRAEGVVVEAADVALIGGHECLEVCFGGRGAGGDERDVDLRGRVVRADDDLLRRALLIHGGTDRRVGPVGFEIGGLQPAGVLSGDAFGGGAIGLNGERGAGLIERRMHDPPSGADGEAGQERERNGKSPAERCDRRHGGNRFDDGRGWWCGGEFGLEGFEVLLGVFKGFAIELEFEALAAKLLVARFERLFAVGEFIEAGAGFAIAATRLLVELIDGGAAFGVGLLLSGEVGGFFLELRGAAIEGGGAIGEGVLLLGEFLLAPVELVGAYAE